MTKINKKCEVAILAGGMGTRLRERSGDMPKPMVSVLGKPLLQYQIELCRKYGFINIILLVQHRHEKISEYFGDGSALGVNLQYVIEDQPRGTAGALRDALFMLADRILVLYGDTFMDVDLRRLWTAHECSSAVGTLFLHPNDHPHDSDLVDIDEACMVRAILPYPHPEGREVRNLVNAGLYVLNHAGLEDVTPAEGKADIAKHMFPRMLELGRPLYGYISPEYIKDMGTPERLDKVERDFLDGLPERLSGRQLRNAVFLDRDGTINREVTHLKSPDQLELYPGTAKAIRRLNCSGVLAVVVTNQPVVARGDVSLDGLGRIHSKLEFQLGAEGAFLNGLYFCPHHPDKGFPAELVEFKGRCNCRKPEPGLIDKACRDLGIDRQNSWMIGDTSSDILAGKRAGLRTILVKTGYAGRDYKYDVEPDFVANDLYTAVEWILHGHANVAFKLVPLISMAMNSRIILIGGASRAGKSSIANVLVEMLNLVGKKVHILPLDGWLKPYNEREEGAGVLSRYKLETIINEAKKVSEKHNRVLVDYSKYDTKSKQIQSIKSVSIGSSDIVIFEGVPALLDSRLFELSNLSIYVDLDDDIRLQRLKNEYFWRGENQELFMSKIISRESDELPFLKEAGRKACYKINF